MLNSYARNLRRQLAKLVNNSYILPYDSREDERKKQYTDEEFFSPQRQQRCCRNHGKLPSNSVAGFLLDEKKENIIAKLQERD